MERRVQSVAMSRLLNKTGSALDWGSNSPGKIQLTRASQWGIFALRWFGVALLVSALNYIHETKRDF